MSLWIPPALKVPPWRPRSSAVRAAPSSVRQTPPGLDMVAEVHSTAIYALLQSLGGSCLWGRAAAVWVGLPGVDAAGSGPLRPLGAGGPSTQNCLPAPAPDVGRAQALVRLPPLRAAGSLTSTPPPPAPSTAGRSLCNYPPPQPRVDAVGLNPGSPAGSGKHCSGSTFIVGRASLPPVGSVQTRGPGGKAVGAHRPPRSPGTGSPSRP